MSRRVILLAAITGRGLLTEVEFEEELDEPAATDGVAATDEEDVFGEAAVEITTTIGASTGGAILSEIGVLRSSNIVACACIHGQLAMCPQTLKHCQMAH